MYDKNFANADISVADHQITQTLENDVFLAEALFYSEVTRFNVDEDTAIENLHANLRKLIESNKRHGAGRSP